MKTQPALAVATWNVHRTVGRDGRADPARVERAIAGDIAPHAPRCLALQEADSDDAPHPALLETARIERDTGLRSVHGRDAMRWGAESGGFLGNILFLDPDLEIDDARIVELPGQCPRAAVLIETRVAGVSVRIVSCHLSLSQMLRGLQLRLIGHVIARRPAMQTIVLGDLNEWRPWGGLAFAARVCGLALHGPRVATFPVGRPVLPLDRVLSAPDTVREATSLDGPEIREASDHRPLFARVALDERLAA